MVNKMLIRKTIYPRPHNDTQQITFDVSNAIKNTATNPLIHYDEGLGDPASYQSHPEHSSFAEYAGSNCYPDSHVNRMTAFVTVSISKVGRETDKLQNLRIAFIPLYFAFKEDYEAIDELSTLEVQDVAYVQKESTDRQGGPLFSGTDFAGAELLLGADTPFLTTDTKFEGINVNLDNFYDMMNYGTIAGKLKKCMGPITWKTVSYRSPIIYNLPSQVNGKVKFMNPYTFCGLMVHCPNLDEARQLGATSEITAIQHLHVKFTTRYLEWNENFDHTKV